MIKMTVMPAEKWGIDSLVPFLDFPACAIRSPAVAVRAGQFLRISVLVKRTRPTVDGVGGVIVRDSIGGEALQFVSHEPMPVMTRVVLYRRAPADGELTVTLGLAGYDSVFFDDLRVERVEAAAPAEPAGVASGLSRRAPRRPAVAPRPRTSPAAADPPDPLTGSTRNPPILRDGRARKRGEEYERLLMDSGVGEFSVIAPERRPVRVPQVVPNPCRGKWLGRTGWVQPVAPQGQPGRTIPESIKSLALCPWFLALALFLILMRFLQRVRDPRRSGETDRRPAFRFDVSLTERSGPRGHPEGVPAQQPRGVLSTPENPRKPA